jgi:hypothetical protein
MKIFMSWSGERSRKIAEAFREWLPGVLQAVQPYFTPDDISKGTRWNTEIANELENSSIGLLFITAENLDAKWLMFEAGALSKNLEKSKVIPILLGIEPTDIEGPLVQFQAAKFGKPEMKKVIKSINTELGESALPNDVLGNVFEMWWPKLEEKVTQELASVARSKSKSIREERDLLMEILELSRDIARRTTGPRINPAAATSLATAYIALAETCIEESAPLSVLEKLGNLHNPLKYILRQLDREASILVVRTMKKLDRAMSSAASETEEVEDDIPF